jgi:hypothetical protein
MGLVIAKPTYKAPRMAAQAVNHKFALVPAPVLGLDTSRPFTDQDPKSAMVLQNFIARRNGSEVRGGYRRYKTNLGGIGTESPVASLMAYLPPRGAGSLTLAKLFAACENGNIYDATDQTAEAVVPAVMQAVPGQTEPGEFSWINFATANTNYLCAVSAGGGYWTYDATGGWIDRTLAIIGAVGSGINFDFIMAWKERLWFIKENSTQAWYLPVGAIVGTPVMFDFGPLLTHGGELRAMASWTGEDGAGLDDRLVIVGAGGDVLVYGGTDPSAAATFGLIGRWFIGPPPAGRKFMGKYGGDLGILCETGVEYMSRLVEAHGLSEPEAPADDSISRRYNEVIGADIRGTRGQSGWAAVHVPGKESVIVVTPYDAKITGRQYCFSTIPAAWSIFKALPISCAEVFNGDLYFGTPYGTIGKAFAADTDDELTNGTIGVDVRCDLQTAFVAPNDDRMSLKRPQLVMPMFTAPAPPSISVKINTEWSDQAALGALGFPPDAAAVWDVAVWDVAVWAGALNTYLRWIGVSGLGCYMSLCLSLIGKRGTIFTSWKLVYEPGGIA